MADHTAIDERLGINMSAIVKQRIKRADIDADILLLMLICMPSQLGRLQEQMPHAFVGELVPPAAARALPLGAAPKQDLPVATASPARTACARTAIRRK